MWKTFVASPLAGGIAGLVGWLGALWFKGSMSEADFAELSFGWNGALIGAIALATIVMIVASGRTVEPIVTAAAAVVAGALLWGQEELPFSTDNFTQNTNAGYWFSVTTMIAILVLLLMGLRAARETNNRARG